MNEDFRDLLSALSDAEVRFMVIGAYAVGIHGHPRATKDLDIWIEASPDNATRVIQALRQFGAPLLDLCAEDLSRPGIGFMMGVPPRRIDVITKISGLEFADAWARRIEANFGDELRCPVISIGDLLINKRASDRLQDRADVDALERLERARRQG